VADNRLKSDYSKSRKRIICWGAAV